MLGVSHIALVIALARPAAIDLGSIPPGASCPSAAMLADALEARLPGVAERGAPPDHRGGLLRLELAEMGPTGVHFSLVDGGGRTLLERSMALPDGAGADRAGACAARAETVALVVERYLQQLGYRDQSRASPPAAPALRTEATPPAPARAAATAWPRFAMAAGVAMRPGDRWPTRTEPELVAELGAGRVTLSLALAFTVPVEVPIASSMSGAPPGQLRYQALAVRLGVGWPLHLPGQVGWVAPTLLAGVDVFGATTSGIANQTPVRGVEPAAELGLVAMLRLANRLALRPQVLVGVQKRRNFELRDPAELVFADPGLSLRIGIDLAYLFGKK